MASRTQRSIDQLNRRVDAFVNLQKQRPSWGEIWRNAAATGVFVIIGSISVPVVDHVLEDRGPSACSIQYGEISKAVKSGIDNPKNLEQLAHDGCSIPPAEVLDDIRDN